MSLFGGWMGLICHIRYWIYNGYTAQLVGKEMRRAPELRRERRTMHKGVVP